MHCLKESLRRSQLEIIVDVLNVIKEKPQRLSHITLKAKINFATVKDCLIQLAIHNLIEERTVIKRKQENVFYALTQKGIKFLKTYQNMTFMFTMKNCNQKQTHNLKHRKAPTIF